MAERDVNIPFGPDQTQSYEPIDVDAIAESQADSKFSDLPSIAPESGAAPYGGAADGDMEPFQKEVEEDSLEEMQSSFAALRDSIGQGRELKARERDREELGERIKADREELADRENILQNYQSVVAEQDAIIMQNTQQRDARKAELSRISADLAEAQDALDRMKDYHDQQLIPIENELGRARANAERTKNDERSRKAELSAAEKEADRAEGGDSNVASAKVDMLQQAYDDAVRRSNDAKEVLDQVQKDYDDAVAQVEQAESPLERSIEDMNAQIEDLKESINRLGETISSASKRRQYCDSVYQYPDETAKLRQAIEDDESLARQMDVDNDDLRNLLEANKKRAKTAKIAIGAAIAIVVIIIIAIIVVATRGF